MAEGRERWGSKAEVVTGLLWDGGCAYLIGSKIDIQMAGTRE